MNWSTAATTINYNSLRGTKSYELSNHLGNVMATVSDVKKGNGSIYRVSDGYEPVVKAINDYYPFGMTLPNRNYNASDYKYGFNGMEKDDEVQGSGNSYDFGARIYDGRVARWLSLDPLMKKYPSFSAYSYPLNSPIMVKDIDGREGLISIYIRKADNSLKLLNYKRVQGHVTKEVHGLERTTLFGGKEKYDGYQSYDFTQSIILDPNAENLVEIGDMVPVGKPKSSAGNPAIARAKGAWQDRDKKLTSSFKIREATEFEQWMENAFDQDEIIKMKESVGEIFSASPDMEGSGDERVLMDKNKIELLDKLSNLRSEKEDWHCDECKRKGIRTPKKKDEKKE